MESMDRTRFTERLALQNRNLLLAMAIPGSMLVCYLPLARSCSHLGFGLVLGATRPYFYHPHLLVINSPPSFNRDRLTAPHRWTDLSDSDSSSRCTGAIPDVVISKPPRNNQFRVVVALGVGC